MCVCMSVWSCVREIERGRETDVKRVMSMDVDVRLFP